MNNEHWLRSITEYEETNRTVSQTLRPVRLTE